MLSRVDNNGSLTKVMCRALDIQEEGGCVRMWETWRPALTMASNIEGSEEFILTLRGSTRFFLSQKDDSDFPILPLEDVFVIAPESKTF